jgi:CRAL/TRIO domain
MNIIEKHDDSTIARLGNGHGKELSKEQFDLIHALHARVTSYREDLPPYDADFCDLETCRRYLVARQWNLANAEAQLVATLTWRKEVDPRGTESWQSPKALKNPLALNMRIVGCDRDGRPISYTRFSEAHDRWDVDSNMAHIQILLESCSTILQKRRKNGYNQTADTRQGVWVVDFDGFGLRDQNPRSAILTAQLLQHYPEMLHMVVCVDAPIIFNGLWKLLSPLLDDRVRSKVMFVQGRSAEQFLQERLGKEAAKWIAHETMDSNEKKADGKRGNPKRYWIAPPEGSGEHDPRGLASYVNSEYYCKTPGDAYEEARQKGALQQPGNNSTRSSSCSILDELEPGEEENLPETRPSFVASLYSGVFYE